MKDIDILRSLAKIYAQYALDGRSESRKKHYREHNALKITRPPVLVFEVPWGEYTSDSELFLQCEESKCRRLEIELRRSIYQFKYFEGDYAVHNYYRSPITIHDSGNGLITEENTIQATTGTDIIAHSYKDIIPNAETFLKKIKDPVITYDKNATNADLDFDGQVFEGIMPVKKAGIQLYLAPWDQIPRFHGVENCLMDLYDDPEYAHLLISTFTNQHISRMKQYEAMNILDTDPMYIHCTPAATYDLPILDMDRDKITLKSVWARSMAQIFAVVSPEMHEEFDLQYTRRMFELCGLSYYGCCEPLHNKIEKLHQFDNLRRISITAWADVDIAAEKIGNQYILSYKANPAFVAMPSFNPEPVKAEIKRVLDACRRNNTPCEFILKDISTTANHPENLTKWVDTVNACIDRYF